MSIYTRRRRLFCVVFIASVTRSALGGHLAPTPVALTPARDNTLFAYDPSDTSASLNSNGQGDFFSAGRTLSRGSLRRGLLMFDLSAIPAGSQVAPGSVELHLDIVDAPRRDRTGEARDFWLIPLAEPWGEGASQANAGVSGAGSGAPAQLGDATWIHRHFDPLLHALPITPQPSHWQQRGVLGDDPVDRATLGEPAGSVPAAPYLGPVIWSGNSLESDLNRWLSGAANHGWLVIGDESITSSEASSARGFASRESSNPPQLRFSYVVVPEPTSLALLLTPLFLLPRRNFHDPGFADGNVESSSPSPQPGQLGRRCPALVIMIESTVF